MIKDHAVPHQLIRDVFELSARFFGQATAEKERCSMELHSQAFRGYAPVFSEKADHKYNWYELFEVSNEIDRDDPRTVAQKPMHGPNVWPAELPGFRATIEQYVRELLGLGGLLMESVIAALEENYPQRPSDLLEDPWWQLRLLHYPERERVCTDDVPDGEAAGEYSCGAHTDYGWLTLILADEPGLQVWTGADWAEVPPQPNAFLVNAGDMLDLFSRGRMRATPHRVMSVRDRVSVPFFLHPNFDAKFANPIRGASGDLHYGTYIHDNYKRVYPGMGG